MSKELTWHLADFLCFLFVWGPAKDPSAEFAVRGALAGAQGMGGEEEELTVAGS